MKLSVGNAVVSVNIPDQGTLLAQIEQRLTRNEGFAIATLNLDHLVKLRSDAAFGEAYARQDLVTADGNPIVWLARVAGQPLALLPGSDLIRPVLQVAARVGAPVAFLGSTEAALSAAARALMAEIPGLEVRACLAPPMGFDPASPLASKMLDDLAAQGVRLVLLALGAPKQERLAALGRARQPGLGFLSIGAGLDFIAGSQRRAPLLVRRLALEWLWRMLLSPRRLARRYLDCILILPSLVTGAWTERRGGGRPSQSFHLGASDRVREESEMNLGRASLQHDDGMAHKAQGSGDSADEAFPAAPSSATGLDQTLTPV
jgi:N-acetylglucosaminyldiphosphoundecaprenol N-acetyl-beta-D-mannosaminyltransferase